MEILCCKCRVYILYTNIGIFWSKTETDILIEFSSFRLFQQHKLYMLYTMLLQITFSSKPFFPHAVKTELCQI